MSISIRSTNAPEFPDRSGFHLEGPGSGRPSDEPRAHCGGIDAILIAAGGILVAYVFLNADVRHREHIDERNAFCDGSATLIGVIASGVAQRAERSPGRPSTMLRSRDKCIIALIDTSTVHTKYFIAMEAARKNRLGGLGAA